MLNLLLVINGQQLVSDIEEEQHPEVEEQYRLYLEPTDYDTDFDYLMNGTDWKSGLCDLKKANQRNRNNA